MAQFVLFDQPRLDANVEVYPLGYSPRPTAIAAEKVFKVRPTGRPLIVEIQSEAGARELVTGTLTSVLDDLAKAKREVGTGCVLSTDPAPDIRANYSEKHDGVTQFLKASAAWRTAHTL
jgi:hypothetical protein